MTISILQDYIHQIKKVNTLPDILPVLVNKKMGH